jgi:Cytochrome P450
VGVTSCESACRILARLAVFVEIFTNLHSAHMAPDVWPDPSEFRPERFLDKDGQVVNKDAVIPFSLGWYIVVCIRWLPFDFRVKQSSSLSRVDITTCYTYNC